MTISPDVLNALGTLAQQAQQPRRGASLVKSFDQRVQMYNPGDPWTGDDAIRGLKEQLVKAMGIAAGSGIGETAALQLENLDATMTEVLITEQFMKIFAALDKIPSKNALFEWNRKKSHGSFRGTAGFREGGAPRGSTSKYERKTAQIRYLGERGGVTHQLSVAGDMGGTALDPVAEENRNTTIRLLAKVERALVRGRSAVKDGNGADVNYDGIITHMAANYPRNVINLKGQPLSLYRLDQMAYDLFTNGKLLDFGKLKGFVTGHIPQDIGFQLLEKERSTLSGTAKGALIPGGAVPGYQTQFGFIPFEPSQFLDEVEGDQPLLTAGDDDAPAAPAAPTGTAAANAASEIPAGSYYYFASAFGEAGESLATATAAAVAVTAGQQVTVSIPRVNAAIGYRLYRGTKANGSDAYWIATIPQPGSGNASHVDVNQKVPGTGTAIFMNADPADIAIAQLAPLVKWPLAITSTTVEFLLLLYHTLVIKAAERVVVFENVGKAAEPA